MYKIIKYIIIIIFISCSQEKDIDKKTKNRINQWVTDCIEYSFSNENSKQDSIYLKEAEQWQKEFKNSKDELIKAKINFIHAKLLNNTSQDSLANVYFYKSLPVLEKNENSSYIQLIDGYYSISENLFYTNNLEITNDILIKSVYYAEKYYNRDSIAYKIAIRSLLAFGQVNRALLNNEVALKYLNKSIELSNSEKYIGRKILASLEKSTVLRQLNRTNEAEKNIEETIKLAEKYNKYKPLAYNHAVSIYGYNKKYKEAYKYFILEEKNSDYIDDTLTYHVNLSGIFLGLHNTKESKPSIQYLEENFNNFSDPQKTLAINNILQYYILTKDFNNAYEKYSMLEQIYKDYYAEEKAKLSEDLIKKYELRQKDDKIKQLNTEKKLQKQQQKIRTIIFVVILLILSFALIILYNIYKRKKITEELNRIELEQQLFRSQMNPHFIFNSIANIRGNILNDEKENAVKYLTSFSKLTRNILEQNTKKAISLKEEIETLNNYITIQKMRFPNKFDVAFNIDESIEIEEIQIPPMLIQPHVENVIEHGLKGVNYLVNIDIEIKKYNEDYLQIMINDNGKGIQKNDNNNELKTEKQSLSTIINQKRLKIWNKNATMSNIDVKNVEENNKTGVCVSFFVKIMYV